MAEHFNGQLSLQDLSDVQRFGRSVAEAAGLPLPTGPASVAERAAGLLKASGTWREDWRGGSVVHGTVLYVKKGEILRLDAPFGPLQEMAIKDVWTISVTPEGDGAKIVFDEVVNGEIEAPGAINHWQFSASADQTVYIDFLQYAGGDAEREHRLVPR